METISYNSSEVKLAFGKYEGIRVGRIIDVDPQWLIDENHRNPKFFISDSLIAQAQDSLKNKKEAAR
jgi:hypothetical protein